MGTLVNKRILVGLTGGIAAYKSPELVRRLKQAGAQVRVVMTRGATEFITPLTLQAVSGHPVALELLDTEAEAAMGHIDLARWADAVVVAPASADFLSRLVQGRADELLSAVCLATAAPVAVAPAMNRQMWDNAATRANVATLRQRGVVILGPARGDQACGETGPGRMLEPAEIAGLAAGLFETGALDGLTVLLTAGPTWEALDPVRGLTNRSSGKMGYALAEAAAEAGARVRLVSGPTALPDPERVETVRVTSAEAMYQAVLARVRDAHIFIGVAAVADYRPAAVHARKLKKDRERLSLELVRNPDIISAVAGRRPRPFTVGFAAETEELEARAREKLLRKKLDLVIANPVGEAGTGFEADQNRVLIVDREGSTALARQPKTRLARTLIQIIAKSYHEKNTTENPGLAHR